MQKKLLVSLLVSLALSVPAGYAVYLLTDSDFLSPGILRLMQALAVLLLAAALGGVCPAGTGCPPQCPSGGRTSKGPSGCAAYPGR